MKKYQFPLLLLSLLLHFVYLGMYWYQKNEVKSKVLTTEPQGYFTRLNQLETQPIPKNAIVFIGNSLTEGYNWADSLKRKEAVNMGISGDNTLGLLKRIPKILAQQPSKIFIEIGINDIRQFGLGYAVPNHFTPDSIVSNIEKLLILIKNTRPTCKIYVNSLFPVIDNSMVACVECPNVIPYINQRISILASKYNAIYIDTYAQLVKPNSNSIDEIFTYDGLHLNSKGYAIWRKNIKKQLNE